MVIDPSTNIGRLRLRVGDWSDPVFLPDSVYQSTLDDTSNNVPKSTIIVAQYILAMMTRKTDRKLQQLEVYGSQAFQNYFEFLKQTILSPNQLNSVAPLPYAPTVWDGFTAEAFVHDWNANYNGGTQSQQLAFTSFPPRDYKDGDPTAPYINNIANTWIWSQQ